MNLKGYINFVELPTKVASVIPFIMGVVYSIYRYGEINVVNLTIMFISMITFDMATTAINNYCDYKNEISHQGENYQGKNPIHVHRISQKAGLHTIAILLSIATIFGILLAFKTNILILCIGVICFFIGIFYTFGPIPISRMPLGEVFSGIFMGLFIPFITIYASIYDKEFFGIYIEGSMILGKFNFIEGTAILMVSTPLICGIANIMLANNICDLEEDIKVSRFTLPYYITKDIAIKLYKYIYYFGYIVILLSVIVKILPNSTLLTILSLYIIQKNIKIFEKNQIKSQTFITAVKNFMILGISYIVSIAINLI
ncbi:1,4-dihydroxy-2-naphthoate polyprenyltransferase [Clostridium sp. CCUG 7971]|uniref:1,4-dihydroxy-2-naphthoate polyprenyltransferase n=1 Tax=Clostridium sp. CCUG 7971 TaxID=2811414 RepID=UPI001ABA175B|nr:1,4-dihydroxy-2-naphthoate polyprenyltransferase [Clostridium sp. CCUG 7971]MBO3445492.1 1,4-dihydroxy-2-naphthoate polyprenyltransferase [Clostridium sp. CCUG 7971]